MDIRNFFSQTGAGKGDTKKKASSKQSKSSSSSRSNKAKSSKVAASLLLLSPVDKKDGPAAARQNKKRVIVFSDDDSDATTNNDSDLEVVAVKPAAASSRKKAVPASQAKQLKEVSAHDFFAASSPAAKKQSPITKKSQPKRSYTLDDTDSDDDDFPVSSASNKRKGEDDDIDMDKELPISKKRPSPRASKNPPNKPTRKASPAVKKQKLDLDDNDEDDEDEDMGLDDDDYVDRKDGGIDNDDDEDLDDDYVEETTKRSPRQKKRASSSPLAAKKSPSASASIAETPPSSKKRKTAAPGSSRKTKTPAAAAKKEEPLEPLLELDSFDTDKAVPECMQGYTFVFTGVLGNSVSREDAQDFVKTLGGRVTGNVSSKTTYLVVGQTLEDGRNYDQGKKYQKAVEIGTRIVMGEKKLFGLAKQYSDRARERLPPPTDKENNKNQLSSPATAIAPANPSEAASGGKAPVAVAKMANPYKKVSNPYAKKAANNPYANNNNSNNKAKPAVAANSDAGNNFGPSVAVKNDVNALWVDKYAPSNTREVLGNKDQINKLTTWLGRWESRFNNEQAVGKSFSNPNGPFKAALLSGPPGIGKTTTATLVALEAGRDLLEFNASDVRSKKAMQVSMGDITGSNSVQGYFQQTGGKGGKGTPGHHKKRCIIMDEVDGMGGGDRGGMAELIQMIKNSRVPIICICNDRHGQKVKSLAAYCMDLRFKRPQKGQIAKAAMKVAEREGLHVEQNAAEAMAEACGNDIRQVLNALQMWSADNRDKSNNAITYKGLKDRQSSINKDEILRVSLFDAAKKILEGRRGLGDADPEAERASFFKRTDAFFVDYSFTGLLVQQNYLKIMTPQYMEVKRKNDAAKSLEFLERMHSASECMSDYAMVENKIRGGSDMNWGLLPFSGILAVKTGFHAAGPTGAGFAGFPEFTTWLARNSMKGRKNRVLQELSHHMNYKISGGTQEVRLSYVPFLRQRFLNQLKFSKDDDRNTVAIQLMDDYGLDRDDVFENLDEFVMDPKGPKMADIDSKAKSAFTREYNKGSHKSQALVEEQGAPKKSKRGGGSAAADPDDPDAINDDVEEEEDVDEEADLEKIKAAFKKKGRGKSAGKATAKGKGKGKGKKKT